MNDNLPIVSSKELSKVEDNSLNTSQLAYLLQKTPSAHVYERTAKGGGKWSYVTGTYVKKVLNLMFGWDWDFEVVEYKYDLEIAQVFVLGKLTCRTNGNTIVKMQFGTKDIMFKNDWVDGKKIKTKFPLDLGNDLKAATTSALKKCASEIGIASDVYAPTEFKEIRVVEPKTEDEKLQEIELLLQVDGLTISEEDRMYIEQIVENKESISYDKAILILNKSLPKK